MGLDNSLDLFCLGDFFTGCTMVNHYFSPPFGRICFSFSKHLVQMQDRSGEYFGQNAHGFR